ncbi:MAG: sigma 54-interacting transcriptional regulator [Sandaracinaceae bacterium]|nr:sigma 54-interacting transcriptional regulator [Sandaracinaceae bacterium]
MPLVDPLTRVLEALRELVGAALVLDAELRVVAATPDAHALLGVEAPLGVSAPKLLCGHGQERPVAEALAAGRAVTADVLRPTTTGENRLVRVRALPFGEGPSRGFLLTLSASERDALGADATEAFGIVTRDARMRQLLVEVQKVARSDASVLVRGETGSGKELIARAIHLASRRAGAPFRALNCAALPPNLLESELFGHVRGAFTGAVRDALGHFRLADGGTLFLDEVAELPLEMQAKLLRVLQDRTVIPVGGRDPVPVDVRIVSATHRALRAEVEAGRFRADLLYRLRVIPLFLPPLRDRPNDVPLLVEHFLAGFAERAHRPARRITPGALDALVRYDWPGNVRELQNVVEYALVMGDDPVLTEADLPPEVRGIEPVAIARPDADEAARRAELPAEARRLLNALERAGGHMSRAAASLGMSRTTLWRRLKKHGLDRAALE